MTNEEQWAKDAEALAKMRAEQRERVSERHKREGVGFGAILVLVVLIMASLPSGIQVAPGGIGSKDYVWLESDRQWHWNSTKPRPEGVACVNLQQCQQAGGWCGGWKQGGCCTVCVFGERSESQKAQDIARKF